MKRSSFLLLLLPLCGAGPAPTTDSENTKERNKLVAVHDEASQQHDFMKQRQLANEMMNQAMVQHLGEQQVEIVKLQAAVMALHSQLDAAQKAQK